MVGDPLQSFGRGPLLKFCQVPSYYLQNRIHQAGENFVNIFNTCTCRGSSEELREGKVELHQFLTTSKVKYLRVLPSMKDLSIMFLLL